MATPEVQTASLPSTASWDDVRNATLRALAGRGYLVPRYPIVLERAHFIRTPWEEVEPRDIPDGRSGFTNQLHVKEIRRLHSVRIVYYASGIKVLFDCAEKWPDIPNWQACDDQRNEHFTRAFVGLSKQIADEVTLAVAARTAESH